jgi:hypothetical protein
MLNGSRRKLIVAVTICATVALSAAILDMRRVKAAHSAVAQNASLCSVWDAQNDFEERNIHSEGEILFLVEGWVLVDPSCERAGFLPVFKDGTPGLNQVKEIQNGHLGTYQTGVRVHFDGSLIAYTHYQKWELAHYKGHIHARQFLIDRVTDVVPIR